MSTLRESENTLSSQWGSMWRPDTNCGSQEKDQKIAFWLIKNSKTNKYNKGNGHVALAHLIKRHGPRLVPLLLALKKKFENSRLKSSLDNPEAWITEWKHIQNQMDDIGLMSCMIYEDFMLHIIGNFPEEYESVLTKLEIRLMSEAGNKLIIEVMHQKLNACYKNSRRSKKSRKNRKPWWHLKRSQAERHSWVSPRISNNPVELKVNMATKPWCDCIRKRTNNHPASSAISVKSAFLLQEKIH